MKTSYQSIARWRNRVNVWCDERQCRYVVYRRSGSVERRTSVRYKRWEIDAERALERAHFLACALNRVPASKLASFKFPTP